MLILAPNTFCMYSNITFRSIVNELNSDYQWLRGIYNSVCIMFIDGDTYAQPWKNHGDSGAFFIVALVSDVSRNFFHLSRWAELVVDKKTTRLNLKNLIRKSLEPGQRGKGNIISRIYQYGTDKFTPKERVIFELLAEGKTPAKIARIMDIHPKTVSTHKIHILRKSGFRNFNELMLSFMNSN